MDNSTLILGLGNALLSDEGVGVEVILRLKDELAGRADLRFLDGGTLSFTLAGPIADSRRLIVVDAATLGAVPGSVRVFEGEAMDLQLRRAGQSVHEVSLADLMDMARLTDSLPERRAMIGIQPSKIDWGARLTPTLEAAVPNAMAAVRDLIARWDSEDAAHRIDTHCLARKHR
jgi:hydrogenase maturation protease